MSQVFFIGDLHFGHKNITRFREEFSDENEHTLFISKKWEETVSKNDKVFVPGDACFTMAALDVVARLPGNKILVRGNHDNLDAGAFLKVFRDIQGITCYKGKYWLTHAPIHPDELRGRLNIHGHVHARSLRDPYGEIDERYINVSAENIDYTPRTLQELLCQ